MIRKGTREDLPYIVEMAGHFINQTNYNQVLRFMPRAIAELAEQVLDVGIVFIAEDQGKRVGMICGLPFIEPIGHRKTLDELVWWVEPAYRGSSSVGPRLLRQFENWARQKQLDLCKMIAPVGTNVGDYYTKRGYVPVETIYLKRL